MDSLETQLLRSTRSWKTYLGATVTSVVLFAGMASISLVIHRREEATEPPLTVAYVPPAPTPPPVRTLGKGGRSAAAASLAEALQYDPTAAGPAPDIALDLLDINFDVSVDPGLAVAIDMQRTFEVQKPENPNRYIIYERNQVDEIPVWLYGPNPRVPGRLDRTDCYAHVFYIVTEKGRTEHIYLLDTNDPEFGEAVKKAIAEWRFRPGRKANKAVRVQVQQPVNYEPENKSPFSI